MTAPLLHDVKRHKKLEVEEMPDGSWQIKKINISIFKDPQAAVREINNYMKQKELEEQYGKLK